MSTIDFSNRVAIITGAGGGSRARVCAASCGARCGGGGQRCRERCPGSAADRVVEEIRAAGGTAIANHAAIGPREAAEEIVAAALENFGRIDILINNAGNQANNRFELMSDAEFDAVLEVHLKGAFTLTQLAYREMMKQKYGRILFTSSSSGMLGHFIRSNYSSAKAALVGLMHSVSLEGRTHGILANALLPTAAGSKLGKVPPGTLLPEWEPQMPERQPEMAVIGAAMTVAKVAPLVLYLVSERCTTRTRCIPPRPAATRASSSASRTAGWRRSRTRRHPRRSRRTSARSRIGASTRCRISCPMS